MYNPLNPVNNQNVTRSRWLNGVVLVNDTRPESGNVATYTQRRKCNLTIVVNMSDAVCKVNIALAGVCLHTSRLITRHCAQSH